MSNFLFNDAKVVQAEISRLLSVYPELAEDETLLADSLEGETDLHKILERILSERQEADELATAIKAREAAMKERRGRFERKSDAMKRLIQSLMETAGQTKITLPEATLSILAPRESVDVTDPDALPQGFFRIERKPLSKEIMAALKSGDKVPGAELVLGNSGLMVRTK